MSMHLYLTLIYGTQERPVATIVAYGVKKPPVKLAPYMKTLIQVLAALSQIQLPDDTPEEEEEHGPSTWGPATHVGYPEGAPGS